MGMLTGKLMVISTNHNCLGVSENGVAPYFGHLNKEHVMIIHWNCHFSADSTNNKSGKISTNSWR